MAQFIEITDRTNESFAADWKATLINVDAVERVDRSRTDQAIIYIRGKEEPIYAEERYNQIKNCISGNELHACSASTFDRADLEG